MDWNNLKYFIATADTGSLTLAGRKLGVSAATIGRHIDKLQDELGVSLMRRGRNGITLSEAGLRLKQSAQGAVTKLYDVERLASTLNYGKQQTPIRISTTEPIIADILAPELSALLSQAPDVKIEFLASTEIANLNQQETDLAIRLFKPQGDSLIAKRLPDIRMGCFASSGYLKNKPIHSIDLHRESLLVLSEVYGEIAEVAWVNEQALNHSVILRSSSTRALLEAAYNGLGIAIAANFQAQQYGLTQVPVNKVPSRQAWLVSHRETRNHKIIRIVKNWISSSFDKKLKHA